jgi:sodium-dependent dicarboxylate transporter 2/3/5
MTALLGAALNALLGVASAKEILGAFSDPVIFLFIGSFILAEAIIYHGLDRRFAFAILSLGFVSKSLPRILIACGLISASISMWVSNTATAAMMLPIALGILNTLDQIQQEHGVTSKRTYAGGVMLMIAYGASVGGIATPIGSPPNLIGIGLIENLVGERITFFEWMSFAFPLVIVMFLVLSILLVWFHSKGTQNISGIKDYVSQMQRKVGPWQRGQWNTIIAFSTAVFLWILPSLLILVFGKEAPPSKWAAQRLDEGVVAILASSLLFVLPVHWKKGIFTLPLDQALKIDWGTILLFGGGLSLGKLMFSTGLADVLGKSLMTLTGLQGLWGLTACAIALAIVVSETTSNTASANMVIPVMIALAKEIGVNPIPPALGACLGASFGFMLPISTPPNAIVYGSGRVTLLSMLRAGICFDIIGFFLIWGGLRIIYPWLGWGFE